MKTPDYRYCPVCASAMAPRLDGGLERKACTDAACGFIHYNNPKPVVAAVVEYEGKVLLVRNVGWPSNWFALVTGFLEENETTEAAVLRELKEETGLDGEVEELIGVYSFNMMNQVIIAYHVKATGTIKLDETEIAESKSIPPEKVIAWPSGTGEALQKWLRARGIEPRVVNPFNRNK